VGAAEVRGGAAPRAPERGGQTGTGAEGRVAARRPAATGEPAVPATAGAALPDGPHGAPGTGPPAATAGARPPDRLAAGGGPGASPAAAPGASSATQQIQLIAPGGTRILWLVPATPDRPSHSPLEDT
jgi:hypothetical protein